MDAHVKTLLCGTASCQKLHFKANCWHANSTSSACPNDSNESCGSMSIYWEPKISCFFMRYNVISVKCVETGSGYWLSLNCCFTFHSIGLSVVVQDACVPAGGLPTILRFVSQHLVKTWAMGTQNDKWYFKAESHCFPLFKCGASVWILIDTFYQHYLTALIVTK